MGEGLWPTLAAIAPALAQAGEPAPSELLRFAQMTVNGLTLGGIYALIALGYTMVYGVLKLINFAHSEVFMVGAMTGFFSAWAMGFGFAPAPVGLVLAIVCATVTCGALGLAIERVAYRPLRASSRLTALITALAVSMLISYTLQIKFFEVKVPPPAALVAAAQSAGQAPPAERVLRVVGTERKDMPKFLSDSQGKELPAVELAGLTAAPIDLVALPLTAALLLGLWWLTQRTQTGRAIRAVSFDPRTAALMGVNVDRTIAITFLIGSVMAAVAGVMVACRDNSLDPLMGVGYGLKAFVAAVLGGIGSLPGAALGGLLMGLIESYVGRYVPDGGKWKDVLAFGILIGVLLIRPAGIMGKAMREKV